MSKEQIIRNIDAFVSAVTGAGVLGHDKFASVTFQAEEGLDADTLEALYVNNDLAATIVERIVHDALRSSYELDWQGATDQQRRDVKDWAESTYDLTNETKEARIYARLFGGGAILLGIDGAPLGQAFPGMEVKFLRAVPSTDLPGWSWYSNLMEQNFGSVATYMLNTPTFQPVTTMVKRPKEQSYVQTEIHESRFIPFYGILTTDLQQWRDRGWGKSVLHRVYSVLKKFETAFDSVLHTLSEQSIPVYKVKALLDLLASENGELLAKRFELINAAKGAYRAVILDQEEELERVEASLSQSSNVVDTAMVRVAGAAGMPVTILFGREPAGQNATGKSDLENWNQQVASEQSLVLGPAIANIYRWLIAQGGPLERVPEDLKVIFPAVETPSLQDEVNLYAQRAGADAAYIVNQVLTPEEVAIRRAQEPGQFPKIDLSFRREMLAMRQEQWLNPPEESAPDEGDDDSGPA
jgi:phage-related protein (TIGR01555 family)